MDPPWSPAGLAAPPEGAPPSPSGEPPPRLGARAGPVRTFRDRLLIDALDGHGWHFASLEIVLHEDSVELWFAHQCAGICDRCALRTWLLSGRGRHVDGVVTWRWAADRGASLSIRGVLEDLVLPEDVVTTLADHL